MKTASLGAAGIIVGSSAASQAKILGANDRVRVGLVGYSDRCRQSLIPALMIHAKELNFDFVQMQPNLLSEMSLSEATAQVAAATSANTGADNLTSAHMRNWMECIRSRKAPNADVHAGYNHSTAICMTVAALQTRRRVTFDDTKQEVVIS